MPELKSYLPLEDEDFDNIEKIKTIDFFIYRFIKIQDKMGEKLFPAVLAKLLEYNNEMALIDVLHKLEKLCLINSTDQWIIYRKLRNTLTQEYPNHYDEVVEAISLAVGAYEEMKKIYNVMLVKIKSS